MSLYLVILFKQLYMFRAFFVHLQEFLHCMVSRSLWQMCGCVVVWFGIKLGTYMYYIKVHGTMNLKFIIFVKYR
jgi:hypothetical protein